MKCKFWNWVKNEGELSVERTLFLNGKISDETWYGDEVTPRLFKDELNADSGDITVADKILFDKQEEKKPDKEPKQEEFDEGEEGEEGESTKEDRREDDEKKKKFPFQQNAYEYSAKKARLLAMYGYNN